MALPGSSAASRHLEFTADEVTGAIGDSVTVLPLVVALALVTDVSLPHVLVAFGVFQIVWGVVYGLPVSVEPMKALAALAIAGTLSYADLAAAGLLLGVVLLGAGLAGTLSRVEAWIGQPVVRGVQFAVGLLLLETGVGLALGDPLLAGVAALIGLAGVLAGYGGLGALAVLSAGVAVAVATAGVPTPQLPGVPPVVPLGEATVGPTVDGFVAQLAMTVGNAALATSLLFADLLEEDVSPDELATSMGVTNMLAIPAGGIPMCHGCDGVAGKYEFGARTGGANVVAGVGYLGAALVATAALLAAFPLSMLGVLLVVVAVSIGKHVRESSNLALSVGVGALALVTNLGVAFVAGVVVHLAVERIRRGY